MVTHESTLPLDKPEIVLGVPCTPAARCALDLARTLSRPDALSTLDAALAAAACTPDDLATELTLHSRLKGIRQARELVPLADPRAQCRQESHLRLILQDGGRYLGLAVPLGDYAPAQPVIRQFNGVMKTIGVPTDDGVAVPLSGAATRQARAPVPPRFPRFKQLSISTPQFKVEGPYLLIR